MQITMENVESSNWILSLFNKRVQLIAIITTGVSIGAFFAPFFYEKKKLSVKNEITELNVQIDSLNTSIGSDTINYENWSANHIHPVEINSAGLIPLMTISTYLGGNNIISKETRWTKEVRAMKGNIASIQVSYKNTGRVKVSDIKVKLDYYIDSIKQVNIFYGYLTIGNSIYLTDTVRLSLKSKCQMGFISNAFTQDKKLQLKQISSLALFSDYGYSVENLLPNESGAIVFFVKLL